MDLTKVTIFLTLMISISLAEELLSFDPHQLPRPLIIEYPETIKTRIGSAASDDEIRLKCTSWRFAVEANNVSPWKTIPVECVDYVKEYLTGRGYLFDLETVSNEALLFAKSVEVKEDGMDAWIFDIDETLLSNMPYYADHGYGLEVFDNVKFDEWVETGKASPIDSSLRLYEEVLRLGFKIFLMTGRAEKMRSVTVDNLKDAGFLKWDKLILRGSDDHGKSATAYKSEKRSEISNEGYRIIGNSGDQWSDLLGTPMLPASRSKAFEASCIRFLWNAGENNRSVHWIKKGAIIRDKAEGGLGLKCLQSQNSSLLMKQLWRLLSNPNALVSRILKCRYYKSTHLLDAQATQRSSWVWKSLCSVMDIFKTGIELDRNQQSYIWKWADNNQFTVKSGYKVAYQQLKARRNINGESSNWEEQAKVWPRLWRLRIPLRVQIVIWKILQDGLPVMDKLKLRVEGVKDECAICGFNNETAYHVFCECWWAKSLWSTLGVNLTGHEPYRSARYWYLDIFLDPNIDEETLCKISIATWAIWWNRNLAVHRKPMWNIEECSNMVSKIKDQGKRRRLTNLTNVRPATFNHNSLEIYCDGAWSKEHKNGGAAAVAIQSGIILRCISVFIPHCDSALEAELAGINEGRKLAAELSEGSATHDVNIFSDSVEAIQSLYRCNNNMSKVSKFVEDILSMLSNNHQWAIYHISRTENKEADVLARWARSTESHWLTAHAIPRQIQSGISGRQPRDTAFLLW